jgi:hypothetical protein
MVNAVRYTTRSHNGGMIRTGEALDVGDSLSSRPLRKPLGACQATKGAHPSHGKPCRELGADRGRTMAACNLA